ncbi:hypothetical protein [Azovibrio restrictus]|uniref:hypothetical protein n=1 Tax=Azovibrio restrictus TaxID=146938 RepID=UPI0026EA1FA2|nr:hypothetical protein [Azovibrio restrictus]MDD3483031.1 hypothetical protein [Azovibrio restrictus]
MQTDFRRFSGFCGALVLALVLGTGRVSAESAEGEAVIDKYGREVTKPRARGPVLVSIPVAYVFGLGSERSPLYCSPSVRAANASNAVIEELVLGVTYKTASGHSAGSSTSRFTNIKVKRIESHFFNQLEATNCTGLSGELTVVRCVYSTGDDCSGDVETVGFGAIPLRLKPR